MRVLQPMDPAKPMDPTILRTNNLARLILSKDGKQHFQVHKSIAASIAASNIDEMVIRDGDKITVSKKEDVVIDTLSDKEYEVLKATVQASLLSTDEQETDQEDDSIISQPAHIESSKSRVRTLASGSEFVKKRIAHLRGLKQELRMTAEATRLRHKKERDQKWEQRMDDGLQKEANQQELLTSQVQ